MKSSMTLLLDGRDRVERADAQFSRAMEYALAAVRLRNAAVAEDDVTAGRLMRLAAEFSRRACEALTMSSMGATA
jgi:hypothetical protein